MNEELFNLRVSLRMALRPELNLRKTEHLEEELKYWVSKAAKLKLNGEHETYKWEYDTCLEKMALFQRLLDKRQEALLRSSNTKANP